MLDIHPALGLSACTLLSDLPQLPPESVVTSIELIYYQTEWYGHT